MGKLPEEVDLFRGFVLFVTALIFYIGPALVQAESVGIENGYHPVALIATVVGVTVSLAGVIWYLGGRQLYISYYQSAT